MFSGIIEATGSILSKKDLNQAVRIQIAKPEFFDDLRTGDSIAVNGVCLTLEEQDQNSITFTVAAETLNLLNWNQNNLLGTRVNLERSLRFGDRVHGHLVTGHVEALGEVTKSEALGDSWLMDVKIGSSVLPYVWKKGSITLNGVSLTVNELNQSIVSVCLIPETLKRTNLGLLKTGDKINVEPDYMARAVYRGLEMGVIHGKS